MLSSLFEADKSGYNKKFHSFLNIIRRFVTRLKRMFYKMSVTFKISFQVSLGFLITPMLSKKHQELTTFHIVCGCGIRVLV